MILVYEPWAKKYGHLEFNTCITKIIDETIEGKKIYYGDLDQINIIKKKSSFNNIVFNEIKIPNFEKKIVSLITELKNQIHLWKFCKENDVEKIIITNGFPHTMIMAKTFFKNKDIIFIMHGSLEECMRKKKIYELGYYNKFSLKYRNGPQYKYIVLGDSIKKNIIKIIPEIKQNTFSIDHPYEFNNNYNIEEKMEISSVKIGTIGNGSYSKGTNLIFSIEEELNKKNIKSIEIFHVGNMGDINIPENTNVKFNISNNMLSEEEYKSQVKELDYILFFYPTNSYKLTASGAIFDAIVNKKPIIAIKNDYFKYIFDKVGDIGYLCDDIEEIKEIIFTKIINGNKNDLNKFYKNLEKCREMFDYRNIAKRIKGDGIW